MRAVLLLAALTCALALAACSEGQPAAQRANVSLQEWAIEPDPSAITSGAVIFDVRNDGGGHDHELLVLRTDLPAGALPPRPDGSVDETDTRLSVVARTDPIEPTEKESVELSLDPGRYVLICNIVGVHSDGEKEVHYQKGMRAALTVR